MRRGEHGGDWAAYQIQYHGMPLDFSANVSPMGIPAGVKRALYQAVEEVNRYPDPLCRHLRACLGRYHNVSSAQILCGNGASDLIDRLVLALRLSGDGNCAGVFRVWPGAEAGGLSSGGVFPATQRIFG